MRLLSMSPNTSMKLGVHSFLIVAGVPGDHAFCANCQLNPKRLLLRALCPFCVLPRSTAFNFPSFFSVSKEPFVRASIVVSYCWSYMFVRFAATSVS